jgi:hypothetical protein
MKPTELEKYAKVCKKYGITQISLDGVKVSFSLDPSHTPAPKLTKKQLKAEEELKELAEMSEEDLAIYSATNPTEE